MAVLIIGGAYQGKTAYAKKAFGLNAENTADGETCSRKECEKAKGIVKYQELVRRLLREGGDPQALTVRLLEKNPDAVIVMNEVGSGIIPAEREEREWREAVGRVGCFLAASADQVIRVSCGLPVVLKGSKTADGSGVKTADCAQSGSSTEAEKQENCGRSCR